MDIISKVFGVLLLRLEAWFRYIPKFPVARPKLTKTKEKPTCLLIGVWFDCGGSRSSARILIVWQSSFVYVPVRCQEKVPRCVASFLISSTPVICFREFILSDALDKDWDKTRQLKNAIQLEDSVFYRVTFNCSAFSFDVNSIGLT